MHHDDSDVMVIIIVIINILLRHEMTSRSLPSVLCLFPLTFWPPCHQMSEIRAELDTLPMRAMLAAAFITYLSAAPEDRRRHCLESWIAQCGLQSEEQ